MASGASTSTLVATQGPTVLMTVRSATHAGTWYSADRATLDQQLSKWIREAQSPRRPASNAYGLEEPPIAQHAMVNGCKGIIAPHAGYRFSGASAAYAYGCIKAENIRRVFVLGPSHHAYLEGCALSDYDVLSTPIGDLPVDMQVNQELDATGQFRVMTSAVDDAEHSIEMHLPYIRKVFEGHNISVIPLLVGQLTPVDTAKYASVLAEYFSDPATLVVVSSDFCHWGERFRYTRYESDTGVGPIRLSTRTPREEYEARPIYESIQSLDADGMTAISYAADAELPIRHTSAAEARKAFAVYLSRTGNTICGKNPISLLLATLHQLETHGDTHRCLFTHYEQSSAVHTPGDSSVSYATAFVQKV